MPETTVSVEGAALVVAILLLSPGLAADSAVVRAAQGNGNVAPAVVLQAEPFPLEDVRLLEGPFKHAMELDRRYLLSLDADRLLHVFRIAAGLPSTAKPYGGWMAPDHNSRGEFVGLYLSACAKMYAATGEARVKEKANAVVEGLAACQEKLGTGFLHTHPDTFTGRGEAPVPFWYQIHKVMAGLLDVYVYCDNPQALQVARRLGDWAKTGADGLSDDRMQKMLEAEHGGINEALANLCAITGDRKYLALAMRFNHMAVIGPASKREDRLTGLHANTQIPKFVGTARQYELTGEEWLKTASALFWDTVVHQRSYVIGGHSLGERFTPKEELSQALGPATCETCNTYNMLKLTRHLFFWDPRAEYADYYERALYNHILASQDPETGMMCYFVPLGFGPKCRKAYCSPEDSFWCCTGTGIENHTKYGDSIYFRHGQTTLFVNLFIASELNWRARGLRLRQETNYPDAGSARLVLTCQEPAEFNLRIRHPYWAVSGFEIRVNGARQKDPSKPGSYAVLARTWKSGDTVEVSMPFSLRTEGFRDNPRRLAFLHGPLVLCAGTEGLEPGEPACPVAVAEEGRLVAALKPAAGRPSTFTGSARVLHLSDELNDREVTLEPFYRMHGNRSYVVYWDALTPEEWQARERQRQALEARLAARTVDRVIPANEHSERDHNVRGEKTVTGERRWRHATDGGWFSWDMKVLPDKPQELRVKYWGSDAGGREFDILVDGRQLATQKLENNKPGEFYHETYRLPKELTQGKQKLAVRFQAHPGKTAGGVLGCAILTTEE
ncbi:MAG: glycoside hydrolase family 127 protein [Planctomycetota bacterium]|nr:glycoside hydrolase family 127 protein [Planctomycetota bacterium]